MSSAQPPQPSQRYPKRKRRQVSYKIGDESEELGEDLDFALSIQDDPDNEVDWKTAAKKVNKSRPKRKTFVPQSSPFYPGQRNQSSQETEPQGREEKCLPIHVSSQP